MSNDFIIILGESGSGKTVIADQLEKKHKLRQVRTYTTRRPRYLNEDAHLFASSQKFIEDCKQDNVVAKTLYCENYYWTTKEQVKKNDVAVLDVKGCYEFKEKYYGSKNPIIIYIKTPLFNRIIYMRHRGDRWKNVFDRIKYDYTAFKEAKAISDIVIRNDGRKTIEELADTLLLRVKHKSMIGGSNDNKRNSR